MPNYDYRCKNCSYEFEEFQKITDSSLVTCPQCKSESLVRIISGGTGLHFKGSGFYQTDYKKSGGATSGESKNEKEGGTNKEGANKEGTKKEETKPETKSESKSETKTETKSSDSDSSKKE